MRNEKLEWRAAVRQKMYKAALAEATRKNDNPTFLYRWEHVQAVVQTAIRLAELTGADRDVVEAAAWLHDVAKYAGKKHPQEGAKVARAFLPETDFPPEKIEAVAQAIEDHMGLWCEKPLTLLESQVLWDADKLTKIGLVAIFHRAGHILSGKKGTTTEKFIAQMHSATWREKTVASMHTAPAKRAAQMRFEAFDRFVDGLIGEWQATDIS